MTTVGPEKASSPWRVGLDRLTSPAVIFGVSVALRVMLGIFNRESNDDHVEVVRLIVNGWHFGEHDECGECFQPKLYYLVAALLLRLLHVGTLVGQTIACQLLNGAAGAVTLAISWRTLRKLDIGEGYKRLAFALLAFNPGFVSITGQATNDTFAILFGTMAFVLVNRWIHERRGLVWLCLVAVLSALSKGNGIVVYLLAVLIAGMAFWQAWRSGAPFTETRRFLVGIAVLSVTVFLTVPFLGPYAHHYLKYGSPFQTNWTKAPPPDWFRETEVHSAGVTSVAAAYFTFRLADLLENPTVVDIAPTPHPRHRTSVWTVAYGTASSPFYALWPRAWVRRTPAVMRLNRALYLLGLVPLLWFLVGFATTLAEVVRGRARRLAASKSAWTLLWTGGFLAVLVKYTYDYRDYAAIKAIFVYPAILPMTILIATGMTRVRAFLNGFRLGRLVLPLLWAATAGLIACGVAAIVILIVQVSGHWRSV